MNINFVAPINNLSYGYTGINFVRELTARGNKVALWPIGGNMGVTNPTDVDAIKSSIQNTQFFDTAAPCVRLWHQNEMAQFVGRGDHYGFPIFELDEFSPLEKHHLSSVDHLLVPSRWAKSVVEKNGIIVPTTVVPLGVDTSIFRPSSPFEASGRPTIFFNGGKWEVRKGHDILIKAFKEAFVKNEKVELWLMTDNVFNNEQENAKWKALYNDPRVRFIPRVATQQDVYNIMSQTHCGVFPARAEGWNLEAIEMMACGKHVIITDYSAHTEYCNSENADLITIDEVERAYDQKWFFGQGSWAKMGEHQIEQLADYMVSFHDKRTSGVEITNQAGIATANRFSWANAAKTMEGALDV